jgi:mRNA interferase MazF
MPYNPKQGDIIIFDFDPQTGHEQKGRRPGLIVSNEQFHRRTNMALVCPVTNTISGFPTHILLDNRTKTNGVIIGEQVKCMDIIARNPSYIESIPSDILDEIIDLICSFIE